MDELPFDEITNCLSKSQLSVPPTFAENPPTTKDLKMELWGGSGTWEKLLVYPGIPTTMKTMGVNITTIVYLRVLIIQIGSTIVLMVVEA